jgi:hypothetical protein
MITCMLIEIKSKRAHRFLYNRESQFYLHFFNHLQIFLGSLFLFFFAVCSSSSGSLKSKGKAITVTGREGP